MGCICLALLLFCSNGFVRADETSLTSSNKDFDFQSIAERQVFVNDCEHVTPTQLICPCHCPFCQSPLCNYATQPPPQGCPCQTNKIIVENNAFFRPTMDSCAASCIGACKVVVTIIQVFGKEGTDKWLTRYYVHFFAVLDLQPSVQEMCTKILCTYGKSIFFRKLQRKK